ncbi:MAG: acetyltransferase [Bacteroidetes bacterium]|nr:MAG: acetyltransferase [Bacteroidota bacterium]
MTDRSFYILGQSNYALSVVLDTLRLLYPADRISVEIVANLPPEQNDSLAWPYATPGVEAREVWWEDWTPQPGVPCLPGSIGRGRGAIVQFFQEKFGIGPERYGNTIHPSAVVPPTVEIGRGVHISPGVVVAPYARLGDFVVLNRSCSIGHHTTLDDLVSINPGVTVSGVCRIGRGVTIGSGATVLDQIAIGADTLIGAGSVVTKDVPAGVVAYGVPAKVVRSR